MKKTVLMLSFLLAQLVLFAQTTTWNCVGNSGTTPGTHYIGTSTNQDLYFKRNGITAGFIGTTNTSFGLNTINVMNI